MARRRAIRGQREGRYSAAMPSPARPGGPHDEHPSPGPRSRDEPDPRPQLRPAAAVLLMLEALLLAAVATYSFLGVASGMLDRKSTRLNSSHVAMSYAVFCLQK